MTRLENEMISQLKVQLSHLSPTALIDYLFEHGMLSYRQIESEAIYRHYTMLREAGRAACRAMDDAANHFGCSYEKVRAIIYSQNRNRKENGTED